MLRTLFGNQIRRMGGTEPGNYCRIIVSPLVDVSFLLHSGWLYPEQPM